MIPGICCISCTVQVPDQTCHLILYIVRIAASTPLLHLPTQVHIIINVDVLNTFLFVHFHSQNLHQILKVPSSTHQYLHPYLHQYLQAPPQYHSLVDSPSNHLRNPYRQQNYSSNTTTSRQDFKSPKKTH